MSGTYAEFVLHCVLGCFMISFVHAVGFMKFHNMSG